MGANRINDHISLCILDVPKLKAIKVQVHATNIIFSILSRFEFQ